MPQHYEQRQWLDFGPCEVSLGGTVLGDDGTNVNGGMHGGARLQISVQTAEAMRDAHGKWDDVIVRQVFAVQCQLTGLAIAQMAEIIPGSTLSAGATDKALTLGNCIGTSMRENAQQLILKPVLNGAVSEDEAEWATFDLAYPKPEIDLAFSVDNQKVYNVTFAIFEDATTGFGYVGIDDDTELP